MKKKIKKIRINLFGIYKFWYKWIVMKNIRELKKLGQNLTLLYVEDDVEISKIMFNYFLVIFKNVFFAQSSEDALEIYENNKCDLIITDIILPKMNGLEFSKHIKTINSDQNIIIMSAYSDSDKFSESIKIDVLGYLIKPVIYDELNDCLYKATLKIKKLEDEKKYEKNLKSSVKEKTKQTKKLEVEKKQNFEHTLYSLVELIESRDIYTGLHSARVAKYSKLIANEMGYDENSCEELYRAGILHDLGKIVIPDSLLLKPSKFTSLEHELMEEHVNLGYKMLNKIPMFKKIAKIINCHHERLDGSGYPNALHGDEIPMEAQILSVCDTFDAMTTDRVYKPKRNIIEAISEIEKLSSVHFNDKVVLVASRIFKNIHIDNNVGLSFPNHFDKLRLAYFYNDSLTGLYNDVYLSYCLAQNKYKEVCVVKLNNFREYNILKGWTKGNEFLSEFSHYFSSLLLDELLFRIHGDYFVILNESKNKFDKKRLLSSLNDFAIAFHAMDLEICSFFPEEDNIKSIQTLENLL